MSNPTITNYDITQVVYKDTVLTTKTILTTQKLTAGAVLGVVTATGKLKLCDSASSDGSEVAAYVLPYDIDTTGGDKDTKVIKAGYVFQSKLNFGGTDTIADHDDELRGVSIITVPDDTIGALDNQ